MKMTLDFLPIEYARQAQHYFEP